MNATLRARSCPVILVIAAVVWGAASGAAVALASAPEGDAYGFASHVPADRDTLVVIRDPWPYFEKAVRSHEFVDSVLDFLEVTQGDRPAYDPDAVLAQMAPIRPFLPVEIAAGFTSDSLDRFSECARLVVYSGLSGAWIDETLEKGGGKTSDERLAKFQREFTESLRRVTLPDATIYVRFANAAAASFLYGALKPMLQQATATGAFELEQTEKRDSIRFQVGNVFDDASAAILLTDLGLGVDPSGDGFASMVEVLRSKRAEMHAELRGDALVLTLGPRAAEGAATYDVGTLGLAVGAGSSASARLPWIAARWDISGYKRGAAAGLAAWKEWESTDLGRRMKRLDDTDAIGTLTSTSTTVALLPDRGTLRLDVADGIHTVVRTHGGASAPTLASTSILEWLPADVTMVRLDARSSIGSRLAGWVRNFEDQLATRLVQYEWSGDQDNVTRAAYLEGAYYENFGDFRSLVLERGPSLFAPPSAIMVAPNGRVRKLSLTIPLDGSGTNVERHAFENLEVPELVMLGRRQPGADSVHEFFADIWGSFFHPFLEGEALESFDDKPLATKVDLGLGVDTYGFRPLHESFGARVAAEGDLRAHVFEKDGWFVFSTSPRLSRAMLAARKDAKLRWKLPSGASGALGYNHGFPEAFASVFDLLADLIHRSTSAPDAESETRAQVRAVRACADLVRSVETWETIVRDVDGARETRNRLILRSASPTADSPENAQPSAPSDREKE